MDKIEFLKRWSRWNKIDEDIINSFLNDMTNLCLGVVRRRYPDFLTMPDDIKSIVESCIGKLTHYQLLLTQQSGVNNEITKNLYDTAMKELRSIASGEIISKDDIDDDSAEGESIIFIKKETYYV